MSVNAQLTTSDQTYRKAGHSYNQ